MVQVSDQDMLHERERRRVVLRNPMNGHHKIRRFSMEGDCVIILGFLISVCVFQRRVENPMTNNHSKVLTEG